MALSIVILCQGQQQRLPGLTVPKPLMRLQICRETILGRTLRLVRDLTPRDSRILVVAGDTIRKDLLPFPSSSATSDRGTLYHNAGGLGVVTLTKPGSSTIAGLAQLLPIGMPGSERRTIVLLGDVVYSRESLAKIVHSAEPIVFAATRDVTPTQGEVFAMTWSPGSAMTAQHLIGRAYLEAPRHAQPDSDDLRLALWKHVDFTAHPKELGRRLIENDSFLTITDWTQGFDTPEDLEHLAEIDQLASLEEDRYMDLAIG